MRPGAARWLVTFLARPRKVTKRRPPQESRPVFTGWPCAACPGKAAAELDLGRHTQRAFPWDSNSPRRHPLTGPSCSARLMGNPKETALVLTAFTQSSALSPQSCPFPRHDRHGFRSKTGIRLRTPVTRHALHPSRPSKLRISANASCKLISPASSSLSTRCSVKGLCRASTTLVSP